MWWERGMWVGFLWPRTVQWQVLLNVVLYLQVPWKVGDFLMSYVTVSFSRMILLYEWVCPLKNVMRGIYCTVLTVLGCPFLKALIATELLNLNNSVVLGLFWTGGNHSDIQKITCFYWIQRFIAMFTKLTVGTYAESVESLPHLPVRSVLILFYHLHLFQSSNVIQRHNHWWLTVCWVVFSRRKTKAVTTWMQI